MIRAKISKPELENVNLGPEGNAKAKFYNNNKENHIFFVLTQVV